MTTIFKSEQNGQQVLQETKDGTPRFFAEGFGPCLFGFPTCTLTLFQPEVSEPTDTVMRRTTVLTLQVPTVAILELAQNIQNTLSANKAPVEASLGQMREILDKKI